MMECKKALVWFSITIAVCLVLLLGNLNSSRFGRELNDIVSLNHSPSDISIRFKCQDDWPVGTPAKISVGLDEIATKGWNVDGLEIFEVAEGEDYRLAANKPVFLGNNGTVSSWGMPAVSTDRYQIEVSLKSNSDKASANHIVQKIYSGEYLRLRVESTHDFD